MVVIDGAPGMGRTALSLQVVEIAHEASLRTAHVRASHRDGNVPFVVATALGAELGTPPPVRHGAVAAPAEVVEVALDLLVAAAQGSDGVCLIIDDAHWVDEASLRVLLHVAMRAGNRPLGLVLTVTDEPALPAARDLLDELRALPEAIVVRLEPLDDHAAAQLVEQTPGPGVDPAVRDACLRRAAGSPFLLTELLAASARSGKPGEDHVPERVRAAVAARLTRLGDAPAALGRAVHVLGSDVTLSRAACLAGLERLAAEDAADALARAGVTQPGPSLDFAAPLVGAAVGAGLDPFARDRWHRRAAELLAEEGASRQQIALHLLQTSPANQPWVVEHLVAAADEFRVHGDMRAVAELLGRALVEPAPPDIRAALLCDLAFAESRAGTPQACERIEEALNAVTDPVARVQLMREQTRVLWLTGRLPEAVRRSEQAVEAADPGTEEYEQALSEHLAIVTMHDIAAVRQRPALAVLVDRANAGWVPNSPALAATLAVSVPLTLGDYRRIPPLVERVLAEELWRPDAAPYGLRPDFVLGALQYADEMPRALMLVEEGLRHAEAVGDVLRLGLLQQWRGVLAYQVGDLDGAVAASFRSLDGSAGEFVSWVGFAVATLTHARLDQGHLGAADEALALADGIADPDQLTGMSVALARARVLAESGRAAEALELALDVGHRLDGLGHRDGPIVIWRPQAVDAARGIGRSELAARLAAEELEIARRTHWRGRLGRALHVSATVTDGREALDRAEQAVDVLAATPRTLALASALQTLGELRHEVADVAGARAALAEARELAEACGAWPLANEALTGLHATGARPRRTARSGLHALTAAERKVVDLAAEGLTNRQIAEKLMLAPRTVEWHLGHAYAKLDVQSRRDLVRVLRGGENGAVSL